MAIQNINIGTAADNGTGDNARAAGAKINANFLYLDNLISSIASEVENSPYFDMAAMYADQGNQSVGKIQYVLDASAHPDVSTAEARHFEYLGTTVGDHTDYRLLTPGESSDLINPAAYKTFLIEALQDDASPLTTVDNTKISFEYSGVNVTGILFNSVYTDALANFYNTACNIQFYNITTGVLQKASIEAGDWTTVNTDYYRIAITAGAILLADLSVNDRLEFALTQNTSTSPEGTSVLSTGEVGGTKFLREDGDGTCSWQSIPGGGDLLAANNLSDVANAATSRTNLGIDTTANQTDSTNKRFMTDAQEAKLDAISGTNTGDQDLSGLQPKPAEGQFVDGDKTKLDGIESGADVTDATNVAAAGAVMNTDAITDFISGLIPAPADQDYKLIVKAPYAGTITETTTISTTGTCTATFKINTTALGGTANSVSTTEQSQAHASANAFIAGDDIVLTVSSNASCENMSFTIKFTKTLS